MDDEPQHPVLAELRHRWNIFVLQLQFEWRWGCYPGHAAFLAEHYERYIRVDSTIVPSGADRAAVLAWFEERVTLCWSRSLFFASVYLVPASVNVHRRGWQNKIVPVCDWSCFPPSWEEEGLPRFTERLPLVCDRLWIQAIYDVWDGGDDDDGTPLPGDTLPARLPPLTPVPRVASAY